MSRIWLVSPQERQEESLFAVNVRDIARLSRHMFFIPDKICVYWKTIVPVKSIVYDDFYL